MDRIRGLRYLTAGLAAVVAGVHLFHPSQGGHALLVYAQVGFLGDPRPLLFTLGSFALIFGVLLGYNGLAGRRVYLGGILLTLSFLLGYVAWHTVLDHGAFWPHISGAHHTHGNPVVVILQHLVEDPIELASKLAELALLASLIALYRLDSPSSDEPVDDPTGDDPTGDDSADPGPIDDGGV